MAKTLFILKKRNLGYSNESPYYSHDAGLLVSAKLVSQMLITEGQLSKVVLVNDNNDIDREVANYKPTHVIIEAVWVVPEKFDILKKLHPNVTWIVRIHSKLDFLAHEGSIFGWLLDYAERGVVIGCNEYDTVQELSELLRITLGFDKSQNVMYLPNYYPTYKLCKYLEDNLAKFKTRNTGYTKTPGKLKIGCFGAIRPLKNQMVQAIAAIFMADYLGLTLEFYVNTSRLEGSAASSIHRALVSLFARTGKHKLVQLNWKPNNEFISDWVSKMDLVTQVSLSETFNIVSADAVASGVPVLVSNQITWIPKEYQVLDPLNPGDIAAQGLEIIKNNTIGMVATEQVESLQNYCDNSVKSWLYAIK